MADIVTEARMMMLAMQMDPRPRSTIDGLIAEIERLRTTIAEHEAAIAENPDALNLWRFWAQKARDLAAENKTLSERLREAFGGTFSYPVESVNRD